MFFRFTTKKHGFPIGLHIYKVNLNLTWLQELGYGWDDWSMVLRDISVPSGICTDITYCRSDMWNCLKFSHFIPKKEQLPYFEEQEKAWRDKAEEFKCHSIMDSIFWRLRIASSGSFKK